MTWTRPLGLGETALDGRRIRSQCAGAGRNQGSKLTMGLEQGFHEAKLFRPGSAMWGGTQALPDRVCRMLLLLLIVQGWAVLCTNTHRGSVLGCF